MTEVNWLHYQVVYSDRVKLLAKFQREMLVQLRRLVDD
jgi:hypothetical protein